MKGGIYTIMCLINGKIYVGRSVNWEKRLKGHKFILNKNQHLNQHLQSAWNKYGEENFTFELLEEYEERFLSSMEHWWCNMLNTHNRKYGYNIEPTSPFGMIHLSEETKEKLSKALKGRKGTFLGRKHNEESKKKMSDVKKGKKVSSELIEKRRQKQVGKKRTKEQKEEMSKSRKGRKFTEEHKKNISNAKKGKPSNRKGAKHSEETKEKIRISRINNKNKKHE